MTYRPHSRIAPLLSLAALAAAGWGRSTSLGGPPLPTYHADTAPSRGWWNEPQSEASVAWHKERAAKRRELRLIKRFQNNSISADKNTAWNHQD